MKGMGNMMKQAQKLQSQMLKLQEEMAEKTVETTAGGGMGGYASGLQARADQR